MPPAAAGTLRLATNAVPYVGLGGSLGVSKHLNFARIGNRWYKCAGDHTKATSNTPDFQDGRQEIFSVNFVANDWTLEQPYFLRSGMNLGDLQIALPDDGFCLTRNGEIWSFISERVSQMSTADQTAWSRTNFGADIVTQDMTDVGAWNPVTKTWRAILPRPVEMMGDRAWRGIWDAQQDRFIIPSWSQFLVISGAGVDISPRLSNGALPDYGDFDFHSAGIVQDGRTAYVMDRKHGALYSINLDQLPFVLTKVVDLPITTDQLSGSEIVWHPGLRAIVIGVVDATRKLYAYEVDTRKLTTFDRQDGFVNGNGTYVPPSTMFYDPDTGAVISVGGIDWDTGMASPVYWRMTISP